MATSANKPDPFAIESGVPVIGDNLRPTPKFADRISKRVVAVAIALVLLVVGIFLSALDSMEKKPVSTQNGEAVAKIDATKKGAATVPEELQSDSTGVAIGDKKPDAISLPTKREPEPSAVVLPDKKVPQALGDKAQVPAIGAMDGAIPKDAATGDYIAPVAKKITPEEQAELREQQARRDRVSQARTNGLVSKPFNTAGDGAATGAANAGMASLLAAAKNAGGPVPGAQSANMQKSDSDQDQKLDFVKKASNDDRGYHPHVPLPAMSKNEIKTGSFIPMALEQAINSDLPGQITARVTEDVYDSITGCRLLVPAMAKVVGKYDSKVALGQGRMLVVWNSLIFPDGGELNLAGMQGYDSGGQSGLGSDVDNHYLRMFGVTFGLSMITAGVQISVPQPNPGTNGSPAPQTPAQTVAAALAQQYGALGSQILSKYMAVQPTLRNFAGERFVVMVPNTIVFPKVWRTRCAGK